MSKNYPSTPDGRYFVVRGRLWRKSDPSLLEEDRQAFVKDLMNGRRAVKVAKQSGNMEDRAAARLIVDTAKRNLGERGDVWWQDGLPDYNRKMVKNTPYAEWFENL